MFYGLLSVVCTLRLLDTTDIVARGYKEATISQPFLATGFFTVFFAAGAFLAIERDKIRRVISRLATWQTSRIFRCVAMCLLKFDYGLHSFGSSLVDYLRGIGGLGLIALALGNGTFRSVLTHKTLIWLGRVSYSLYLVHTLVIYVITQTIGQAWSVVTTSIVIIPLSLLAAEILARTIEFPSIRLGKKWSTRFLR